MFLLLILGAGAAVFIFLDFNFPSWIAFGDSMVRKKKVRNFICIIFGFRSLCKWLSVWLRFWLCNMFIFVIQLLFAWYFFFLVASTIFLFVRNRICIWGYFFLSFYTSIQSSTSPFFFTFPFRFVRHFPERCGYSHWFRSFDFAF